MICVSGSPALSPQPKEDFKRIGQLVGMLGILCQDPDKATQCSSLEGVGHLYKLLMHHRGEPLRTTTVDPLPPLTTASAEPTPAPLNSTQPKSPPDPPSNFSHKPRNGLVLTPRPTDSQPKTWTQA